MLMVVFSSLFLPLLPKFCLFYLLQAQFHYNWCRTRHRFGVLCCHWQTLVLLRRTGTSGWPGKPAAAAAWWPAFSPCIYCSLLSMGLFTGVILDFLKQRKEFCYGYVLCGCGRK